jgi:hypothetical protein
MIRAGARWRGDWRRAWLALAFLAVALKVLVPPGMMVGSADGVGPNSIPVVICTGHGPVAAGGESGSKAPAHKARPDAPCAFVGHALVSAAPAAALIALPYAVARQTLVLERFDLNPGRGLAAPPPPSLGPPARIL